jgi:hypothetical protein
MAASLLILLAVPGFARAATQRVVFEGAFPEQKWQLKELNPELPADWSSYKYLVLELKASSTQRFVLRIYDAGGVRGLRMHPFGGGVWLRAAVPLDYFKGWSQEGYDLASIGNKFRHSFWMAVVGPFGSLNAVQAIAVAMETPIDKPTIEIRSVRLSKEDPGSEILEKLPVVDEFGQWIPADWPGKIKSLDQLKKEWAAEEDTLRPGDFNYCQYGGYSNTKARATGFFRVEQIGGKWWFVDPDGHQFLAMSVPGMGAGGNDTNTDGRERYYAALPPAALMPAPVNGRPSFRGGFRSWNLFRRYGEGWAVKAAAMEVRRMEAWGLTTGAGPRGTTDATPPGVKRKPYMITLRDWQMEPAYLGMPDVYSEQFARRVDEAAARECEPRKNDPYLVGYYVGNEPPWPGREAELVDMIVAGRPSEIQLEARAFLAKGDTPERRRTFVLNAFEKYITLVNAAVKKHDPNHLNLGLRFGSTPSPPDFVLRMARVFDVYSVNVYDYDAVSHLEKAYKLAGRPILMGEFHFGVPANGLAAGLVQVRDQKERGVAYRRFVEQAAALPCFVGASWFIGVDESVTGRMDGENYNIGFLDVTDRPYRELVEAAKQTHQRLFGVHSGTLKPFAQKPIVQ